MPLMWSLYNFKYIKTMKNFKLFKSLLVMLCMVLMGGGSVKAETVVTFTDTAEGWNNTTGEQSYTKSGVTISTTKGIKDGKLYKVYGEPKTPATFKVSSTVGNITKVEITCTASGTDKYGPGNFTNQTSGTYSFSEKTGTWVGSAEVISLQTSIQVRMTEIVVTLAESTNPSIVLDKSSVVFGDAKQNASVGAETVSATLKNLSGSASVSITGVGASAFAVSPTTLTASGDITITPNTSVVGDFEATLTVSADGATSQKVTISMSVYPSNCDIWEIESTDLVVLNSSASGLYDRYKGSQSTEGFSYNITDVMPNAGTLQFKKTTGYLYNETSFGQIYKIELTTASTDVKVYAGSSENPSADTEKVTGNASSDKIVYNNIPVGCGFFSIKNGTTGATTISKIKVYYNVNSTTLVAKSGENYYATFSSDKAVRFVDAEVYAVNVDGDVLKLNAVESKVVPANTGVLIKTTGATTSYYEVETSETISDNMLKASSVTMSPSDKNYKLAYNDFTNKTGLGFYYGAADGGAFNAKEGGAYLAVPSALTTARCFTFDDVETGINTIKVADEANTAAEVYDLAGRRVSKAQKGLYIVNGVKVIK